MLKTLLLIAWFALPILVWGAMLCVRRRVHPVLVVILCLASMFAGTFILVNYVWAIDAQLLAEVDKYPPGSPQAQRASEEWASDTGRSFLQLLSPVLTAVGYGFLFMLLFGLQWGARQIFPARNAAVHVYPIKDSKTERQGGDDGNPYQSPSPG